MPSNDMRLCIERYPEYDGEDLISVSYGCPDMNWMGYNDIHELIEKIEMYFYDCETNDIECNEDGSRRITPLKDFTKEKKE